MTTNASAVSATLRRHGLLPVPNGQQGLHVNAAGTKGQVTVTIDTDSNRRARELTNDAVEVLTNQGYTVTRTGIAPGVLTVTRKS